MARVIVTAVAADDLDALIDTHSLPADTRERVARAIRPLEDFPLLGAALERDWQGFRFVLGPWRWMIVVYAYVEEADTVAVVTIVDGRSARSPTARQ